MGVVRKENVSNQPLKKISQTAASTGNKNGSVNLKINPENVGVWIFS